MENELKNTIVKNNFRLNTVLKAIAHTKLDIAIPAKNACRSLILPPSKRLSHIVEMSFSELSEID